MEIDPLDLPGGGDDSARDARDARARRLNSWVAITIALLATFMALCKVKDDNIVQAMQQAAGWHLHPDALTRMLS
jgi:uncharacterized protein DUF4337